MEIWQLNTFKIVAQTLHFTRASKELNLTQSAVSHQIKSLEEELGVMLFLRDKRKISLTPDGNRVLEYANKILKQIEVMRQEIEENKESLQGTLKIVTVTRSLNSPFYRIKQDFESIYPEIDLFFESVIATETIFENVRKGISDIGFTAHTEGFGDLLPIPYGKFEMLLVVGKNHRLVGQTEIKVNDLQNEEWIFFEPGNRIRISIDNYLAGAGIIAKNIYETNDGSLIRSMLVHGNRISLLPEWGVFEELEDGKIVSLKVKGLKKYKVQINLIWNASRRTKLMSAVLSFLLEEKLQGIKPLKAESKE